MSPLLLQGRVITPRRELALATVMVEGDRIAWVRQGAVDVTRATRFVAPGDTIVPGFIDLQVNGFAGADAGEGAQAISSMSGSLPTYGVTAFQPTLISRPIDEGLAFVRDCAAATASGARVLGAHLEGPFLNPRFRGAHDAACLLLPESSQVARLLELPPRMMTLAPELPGALDAIRALSDTGVVVSAGHSAASLAEAQAGIDAGIRFGTHLFNAMVTWHHRNPGLPGALLSDDRVTMGLIADGIHVHPSMLTMAVKLAGPSRIALTTDAVAAAASSPGRYILAGREVVSDGTTVRLADGTLAGSAATMDHLVRLVAGLPAVSLRDAVEMASLTPARVLGIEERQGAIRRGALADLVVLDEALRVRLTVIGGQVVYRRDS
jgi:N-acetylglucosamine-6-phosphate deacetylase